MQLFTMMNRQQDVPLVIRSRISTAKTDNGMGHFYLKRMLGDVQKILDAELMENVHTACLVERLSGRKYDGGNAEPLTN